MTDRPAPEGPEVVQAPETFETPDTFESLQGPSDVPPQRLRLVEALRDRDVRLAEMYEAATRIIDDERFPDRLSVAAHAMRELMEKLPEAFDLPLTQSFSVVNLMDRIEASTRKARETSECATDTGWGGEIDEPVASLLDTVERAVQERAENLTSRRKTASELMKRLEPGQVQRANDLARIDVEGWMKRRRYFEQVSHHHHIYGAMSTEDAEFRGRVRQVEAMLLEKLRPPTAADFGEIDELMKLLSGDTYG